MSMELPTTKPSEMAPRGSIERERQNSRERIQDMRDRALILRQKVDDIRMGTGSEAYKEINIKEMERDALVLEGDANRIEMAMRDVK